jgi:lipoyl(octanoyl) transferase
MLGRRERREHLLLSRAYIGTRGADIVESHRGGHVTFHGPGQLGVLPLLDPRRRGIGIADYVRLLEQTMIGALRSFDIAAETWVGRASGLRGEKIGAVGVRIERRCDDARLCP